VLLLGFRGAHGWLKPAYVVVRGGVFCARLLLGLKPSRLWPHTVEFTEPTTCWIRHRHRFAVRLFVA